MYHEYMNNDSYVHKTRKEVPMLQEDELYDLAELFKVFGDSTRIRICLSCLKMNILYRTLRRA